MRRGELLVAEELQPRIEIRELGEVFRHRVAAARVARQVLLRAPYGEVAQRLALAGLVLAEGRRALVAERVRKHRMEGLELGLEDVVAHDFLSRLVAGAEFLGELGDIGKLGGGEVVKLRDVLDAQVDGVDVAARGGQVRGVLDRREGLGGVERVDKKEVRPGVVGEGLGELAQIVEIAHAPGLGGAHRVELRHDAAGRVLEVLVHGGQAGGGHDERARGSDSIGDEFNDVVAQRQVARDVEGGLAPHLARDVGVRLHVLVLVDLARAAVF